VRFPNSFFQLLGAGKKGVTMERTDAQYVVPSVLQPVIELPSPIQVEDAPTAQVQEVSFSEFFQYSRAGAQVATSFGSISQLGAGLWRITGTWIQIFRGTEAGLNVDFLGIAAVPVTTQVSNFAAIPHIAMAVGQPPLVITFSHLVHILKPWMVFVQVPANIAGDTQIGAVAYHANKIL